MILCQVAGVGEVGSPGHPRILVGSQQGEKIRRTGRLCHAVGQGQRIVVPEVLKPEGSVLIRKFSSARNFVEILFFVRKN